jgi:tRNA(Ile)-lysidine synthase
MHEAAGGWEVVRVGDFVRQPTAIQRGLLRELLAELAGQDVEFSLEDIERCRGYILEPERPRSLQLSGSIRAVNAGSSVRFETTDGLGFSRTYPQTGDAIPCQLAVPGSLHLGGGWTIQSCWEEAAGDRSAWLQRGWPHRIVLDGALIDEGLTVRNRRPGDRIRLLGASGRQKISDLMIDRKIPLAARERWPLLAAGDEIIWVVGLARSDIGTVLANAKNGLVIEVVPPDDPTTRRRSGG